MFLTSCFLNVGGLGGFGLELCQWMIKRGARHIVLTSRSGVTQGYQALCIRRWADKGTKVHVSTTDCTTEKGANTLIQEASKIAPVGGIFNLAAVSSLYPYSVIYLHSWLYFSIAFFQYLMQLIASLSRSSETSKWRISARKTFPLCAKPK